MLNPPTQKHANLLIGSEIAIPSRQSLLQFLDESRLPTTHQLIFDHFNIRTAVEKKALQNRLECMRTELLIHKDRKGRYLRSRKVNVIYGRVNGHAKGHGFIFMDVRSEKLFLPPIEMKKVLHGDYVLARVDQGDVGGREQGVVIEVATEARTIVGQLCLEGDSSFVRIDDPCRTIIPVDLRNDATAGDVVVVRITRHPFTYNKNTAGEIIEIIGKHQQAGIETEVAIRKYDLPVHWPAEVDTQLESMETALKTAKMNKAQYEIERIDLRELPLVTIDGEDARDFDDAVYCEPRGDEWRLVVAIADVSHYVKAETALDQEAFKRGNSVYFSNRVIPMLPSALSNHICSINPEEDRYCLVCDMDVDSSGEVLDYRFYPALMHSKARLTYTIVNNIVVCRDDDARRQWKSVVRHLDNLYVLTNILLKQRRRSGTIEFEFPEPHIEFDQNQKISRISTLQRNYAHHLIEECMLSANVCAAHYLREHAGEAIYRNHAQPDDQSLIDVRRFIAGQGFKLHGSPPTAKDYAQLIEQVSKQSNISSVIHFALLQSLSQALYENVSKGHFALGYSNYTHFTSPIRRYSDLVVHRQIYKLLAEKRKKIDSVDANSLQRIATQCSLTERRADDASRYVIARLKMKFMQDKVGEHFEGVILSVKEYGMFVRLQDIFVDGLLHVTALGNEYFEFDPLNFQLVGRRTQRKFKLGSSIQVVVTRVNVEDAKIDFDLYEKQRNGKFSNKKTNRSGKKNQKRK